MQMNIFRLLGHLIKKPPNSSSSDSVLQSPPERSVTTFVVSMVEKITAPTITLLSSALAYWTAKKLEELGLLDRSMWQSVIDKLSSM